MRLYSYAKINKAASVLRRLRQHWPQHSFTLAPGGGAYLNRWCIQVTTDKGAKAFVTTERTWHGMHGHAH